MKFKKIQTIEDIYPFVSHKKEFVFKKTENGATIGFYPFQDDNTFDSLEAIECRGIVFGKNGQIISRPLHKFFNMGEKDFTLEKEVNKKQIAYVYEKIDGSMIATAWHDNQLLLRSQKSFKSDVVALAWDILNTEDGNHLKVFSERVASHGMTAIFELTHPKNRIVVKYDTPKLRLLHVRDNITGEYVLLNPNHKVHQWIKELDIPTVTKYQMTLKEVKESLDAMQNQEGYVVQFSDGDMVKIKCPWYLRLHHSITFLRERDIALSILNGEIDDMKNVMRDADISFPYIKIMEEDIKNKLVDIMYQTEAIIKKGSKMDRKDFALSFKDNPYFSLAIQLYTGREPDYKQWYIKNRLKNDYGLDILEEDILNTQISIKRKTNKNRL